MMTNSAVDTATIDSLYSVETPEGIDLQADLAGPVVRILAYSIDILIRTVIIAILAIALAFFDRAGQGGLLIFMFVLEWFYPVYFEVKRNGQTPGKKKMGLAVVNDDLTPVSWGTSLVRNLLRVVDFLPGVYMLGLSSMMLNKRFARLGDLAAGTLVVHRGKVSNQGGINTLKACLKPTAAPLRLQLNEQQAVVSFHLRQQQLTEGRQQELAEVLTPVCGRRGLKAVEYWHSVGAWLLGARSNANPTRERHQ